MSCLVSKHLCEAEHISTQLSCPSTRGHTISFMLFPLKPHPNVLVLPWLPYSRIFVEQLEKGCLALKYIFLSLISCHTGRFPPGHSHCLCLFTLFQVVLQRTPRWQGALLCPSLQFSKPPPPLFSQPGLATSHRNSTSRKASKINTRYPHLPVTCPCYGGLWFSAWIIRVCPPLQYNRGNCKSYC